MVTRFSVVPVLVVGSLTVLEGCGDADRALKVKTEQDRTTAAVSDAQPSVEAGWDLYEYPFETSHPYKNREHQVFTITQPGAASIRVHFTGFQVESGYDWVKVSSPDGGSAIAYTGRLGDFWSRAIPGPTARIEFSADYSITKYGFKVAGYATQQDGEEWHDRSFVWHTGHPYENGEYQVVEIAEPTAIRMKLLFGELVTEEGYDFVTLYNEAGMKVAEYSGNLQKFETPAIEGRKLYVVFSSDESITDVGASIARYSWVAEAEAPGCYCTANYAPVCGENGKTYSNGCQAGCEQVPVKHDGECGTQGDFCGGIAAMPCAEGWRCEITETYPDAGGSCVQ